MTPVERYGADIIAALAERRRRPQRYVIDGLTLVPVSDPDAYFAPDSLRIDVESAMWSSIRCASMTASGRTPRFPRA